MRVLISFTPQYASYGGALFAGLHHSRPGLQTRLVPFGEAGEAAARDRPNLVVSDGTFAAPGAAEARISAEPAWPSEMRLGGTVRKVVNPTFEDLLRFVDEVGRSAAREAQAAGEGEDKCSPG